MKHNKWATLKSITPKVIMPFTPLLFYHSHSSTSHLLEYYDVEYVSHDKEMSDKRNHLYWTLASDEVRGQVRAYGIPNETKGIITQYDTCLHNTQKDTISYLSTIPEGSIDQLIMENTKEQYTIILSSLDIDIIRFIIFTPKVKNKLSLVDNYAVHLHSFNQSNLCNERRWSFDYDICILRRDPAYSSICLCMKSNPKLLYLSCSIMKKLITSPIDSKCGISIVAQQTRFKYEGLNIKRPGVLQQFLV